MVQGDLESPVGKWCVGTGRFPTSDPNCQGRGRGVSLVCIHFTTLWYPEMRNHKRLVSSCSPHFPSEEVITPKSAPFIVEGLLSLTKLI